MGVFKKAAGALTLVGAATVAAVTSPDQIEKLGQTLFGSDKPTFTESSCIPPENKGVVRTYSFDEKTGEVYSFETKLTQGMAHYDACVTFKPSQRPEAPNNGHVARTAAAL